MVSVPRYPSERVLNGYLAQEIEEPDLIENPPHSSVGVCNLQAPIGGDDHVVHTNQFADAGSIEIRNTRQIQQDPAVASIDRLADFPAEIAGHRRA